MEDKYEVKMGEDGTIRYYKNDLLHREDGPAVESMSGFKCWLINGTKHRLGAPALEWPDGDKEWFINGKLHREDGPAIELCEGENHWWIDNNDITEKVNEWMTSNNIPDHSLWTNKEIALFKLKFL